MRCLHWDRRMACTFIAVRMGIKVKVLAIPHAMPIADDMGTQRMFTSLPTVAPFGPHSNADDICAF